jgi:hypothetical protein
LRLKKELLMEESRIEVGKNLANQNFRENNKDKS